MRKFTQILDAVAIEVRQVVSGLVTPQLLKEQTHGRDVARAWRQW